MPMTLEEYGDFLLTIPDDPGEFVDEHLSQEIALGLIAELGFGYASVWLAAMQCGYLLARKEDASV